LHTLNIRLHSEKLGYIIRHAEDKVIFVDEILLPVLSRVKPEALKDIRLMVVCGKDEGPVTNMDPSILPKIPESCHVLTYEKLLELGDECHKWPNLHEDMPMALCYTSGTTGMPKGVMYSHKSQYVVVLGNSAAGQQGISPLDTALPVVPMFHAMAWGIPYAALANGSQLVLTNEHMKPDDVADVILRHRVTVVSGVPTIWQGIKRALSKSPKKYAPIRGVFVRGTTGGSKFSLSLLRWFWDNWRVQVVQTWGMTETNPLGTTARRIDGQSHLSSFSDTHLDTVGRPVFGTEARIVDPETKKALPADGKSVGELLMKGPNVISAYYKKIDSTPDKFVDGWLNTGDLASITPDGYVVIKDRTKDVIKSGGEWISSIDMANHILKLPNIKHAAVVGTQHPRWDERPIVVIELTEKKGPAPDLKQVRAHCAKIFAKFQLPDDLLIWDEIPVSGTGKIDKKVIRAKLQAADYVHPELRRSKL